VVCGRKEQESEDKIRRLGENIKIINTNAWPVDWKWHSMKDHLQIALDSCTGDVCLKIDADCIFRSEQKDLLRHGFSDDKVHRINIGRINYYSKDIFLPRKTNVIYAINKKLVQRDGWRVEITYQRPSMMSNQPFFFDAAGNSVDDQVKVRNIQNVQLWPINYDGTFLTREQAANSLIKMHKARFGEILTLEDSLSYFMRHKRKRLWENESARINWLKTPLEEHPGFYANFHPPIMHAKLNTITPEMWGYDCFGMFKE